MREHNILVVEDDINYQNRYKLWLHDKNYDIDTAQDAREALDSIIRKYYEVVILDLSLDPDNQYDRSSRAVQEYLKEQNEGIQHIVISGHAQKEDVKEAAYKYGAFDVLFKSDLSNAPDELDKIISTAVEAGAKIKSHLNFQEISYRMLYSDSSLNIWEYNIMTVLHPKGGLVGWKKFVNRLLGPFLPIANHKSKVNLQIDKERNCALGLFWSRGKGIPFSVCIFNQSFDLKENTARMMLQEWLKWTPGEKITEVSSESLVGFVFSENNNINPNEFMLPTV